MSDPAKTNRSSARARLDAALARIGDPEGEGARACLTVYPDAARAAADASDARARDGATFGPLDGAIVTIKDLFDVAGEVTRAGSKVLAAEGKPAAASAQVVKRLSAAGAVIVAKTNMTEFAYSGIGANPHFCTPGNPADRARIPGGSTSGGAVAVADGMCEIAIGSDTGGSTRIPASLCGIVGFKPTQARIPLDGAFPLSFSLDSIGPMANSVAEVAAADAIMADIEPAPLAPSPLRGLQAGVVQGIHSEGFDGIVASAYSRALQKLEAAGIKLRDTPFPEIDTVSSVNGRGGIAPPEAHAIHRDRVATHGAEIDPNVRGRIERAAPVTAADYIRNMRERMDAIARADIALSDFDMLVMPTTPIVAPTLLQVAAAEDFNRLNMLLLRNPSVVNFLDLCAISLPMRLGNALPCGLMLVGRRNHDRALLRIAAAVEPLLGD